MPERRVSGILPLKNGTFADSYYTPQQRPVLQQISDCSRLLKRGIGKEKRKDG